MNVNREHDALLSLGSNVGDRMANLRMAVREIKSAGVITGCSHVYETEPVGYADQDYFYNAAVLLRTPLSPRELLACILEIEQMAGRKRSVRFGPRTLDMDIIFYGQSIINEPGLCVPHPEYHRRYFVLLPASDIAPDWVCPVRHQTVAGLKEQCTDKKWVQRISGLLLDDESGITDITVKETATHGG